MKVFSPIYESFNLSILSAIDSHVLWLVLKAEEKRRKEKAEKLKEQKKAEVLAITRGAEKEEDDVVLVESTPAPTKDETPQEVISHKMSSSY